MERYARAPMTSQWDPFLYESAVERQRELHESARGSWTSAWTRSALLWQRLQAGGSNRRLADRRALSSPPRPGACGPPTISFETGSRAQKNHGSCLQPP